MERTFAHAYETGALRRLHVREKQNVRHIRQQETVLETILVSFLVSFLVDIERLLE